MSVNCDFQRTRNGYDTWEVDAVILELQKQIKAHKDTIGQYNNRVNQLEENIRLSDAERAKNNQRITDILYAAAQTAEQIEQTARQEAAGIVLASKRECEQIAEAVRSEAANVIGAAKHEANRIVDAANLDADAIRRQAQLDYDAAHKTLTSLTERIRAARQNNNQYIDSAYRFAESANTYFSELESVVNTAMNAVPIKPMPPSYTAGSVQPSADSGYVPPHTVIRESVSEQYAKFAKMMDEMGGKPKYPPDGK